MTTEPNRTVDGAQQEKTAAVGFVAFMGLALGPLGLLVAALSVGIERAWGGAATQRGRAGERGRGWLGEQRDWLANDHRQRQVRRDERRAWLTSGADPDTEPAQPPRSRRFRDSIRRAFANVALAAADFFGGARDGWKAAQETRKNGGNFRDIAGSRPVVCSNCQRARVPVVADGLCADCKTATSQQAPRTDPTIVAPPTDSPPGASNGGDRTPPATRPQPATAQDSPPVAAAQPVTPEVGRCGRCGGRLSKSRAKGTTNGWMFCPACDATPAGLPVREFCGNCFTPGYGLTVQPQTIAQHRPGSVRTFIHELTGTNLCPRDDVAAAWHNHLESLRAEDAKKFADTPDPAIQAWLNPKNRHASPRVTSKENTMNDQEKRQAYQGSENVRQNQMRNNGGGSTGPATESNATVLRQKLNTTKGTLNRIAELTDQLAVERATLGHQVRDASEFATSTGQSAQAQQALDESNALAVSMGEQLGNFSQGAVSAEESVSQASEGLRVAENAEDALRSAGADGRAVAPASGANA